jgi:hypothetical protein
VPGHLGQAGHLADAAQAKAASADARRLGFGQHFFAADYLRALAGLALEQRDLDTAGAAHRVGPVDIGARTGRL